MRSKRVLQCIASGVAPALLAVLACNSGERVDPSDDHAVASGGEGDAGDDEGDGEGEGSSGAPSENLDLGLPEDSGTVTPAIEFSYIWIANTPEGTVSKINTQTRQEEGRYLTGPRGVAEDPSRTSVNLEGDMVVVNRAGGITKINAVVEHCDDKDGDGEIRTSTASDDVLPWGEDECVAWNRTLKAGSRPAAWTSGEKSDDPDSGSAVFRDPKVWTSEPESPMGPSENVIVYLLDGDDGAIEGEVTIPGIDAGLGIYGAAVDSNNDFWGASMTVADAGPKLIHVSREDLSQVEVIPIPNGEAYGITVDAKNRVWLGCLAGGMLQRYEPASGAWTQVDLTGLEDSYRVQWIRGMMEDANGELWAAVAASEAKGGLLRVDTDTATILDYLDYTTLTEIRTPTGTSIDIDGYVWLVDQEMLDVGGAFVVDPDTYEYELVTGLVSPYTYSDMTGAGLKNVAEPPEG